MSETAAKKKRLFETNQRDGNFRGTTLFAYTISRSSGQTTAQLCNGSSRKKLLDSLFLLEGESADFQLQTSIARLLSVSCSAQNMSLSSLLDTPFQE
jgi:hypothetical protein